MTKMSAADLEAALEFVAEAHSFEDLDSFRVGILPGLRQLLPCDAVGYNEVDLRNDRAFILTLPERLLDGNEEILARLADQHPLITIQKNGDLGTYKISDFLSVREFHGLDLYDELYSQIGAEDQIAFGIPGPVVIGIAMNRSRRSFSERDRAMLDLLQPHLARAYSHALDKARVRTVIEAFEDGGSSGSAAIVLFDAGGSITHASERAVELLRSYFPDAPGALMPASVHEWLADSKRNGSADAGRTPLVVDGERGRLSIRAVDVSGANESVLVLEEQAALRPESLVRLGLTGRQAEILCLIVSGLEVEAIAEQLFISRLTVRKHIENIYERLGVHSRAAAVAAALGATSA